MKKTRFKIYKAIERISLIGMGTSSIVSIVYNLMYPSKTELECIIDFPYPFIVLMGCFITYTIVFTKHQSEIKKLTIDYYKNTTIEERWNDFIKK